jgi:hypothetical protein
MSSPSFLCPCHRRTRPGQSLPRGKGWGAPEANAVAQSRGRDGELPVGSAQRSRASRRRDGRRRWRAPMGAGRRRSPHGQCGAMQTPKMAGTGADAPAGEKRGARARDGPPPAVVDAARCVGACRGRGRSPRLGQGSPRRTGGAGVRASPERGGVGRRRQETGG